MSSKSVNAGIPWLSIYENFQTCEKTMALAQLLGIPREFAVDAMQFLWFWAQRNNRDSVPDNPAMLAEITHRYDVDPKLLRDALIASKYLDAPVIVTSASRQLTDDDGPRFLVIHNWIEYAGKLINRREISKKSSQKYRQTHKFEAKSTLNPVIVTSASRQHDVTVTSSPNRTGQNRTEHTKEIDKENTDNKKNNCGQFENVFLTDDELTKLKQTFPADFQSRIERLSEYIKQNGRRYKSHYATILVWARRDNDSAKTRGHSQGRGTRLPDRNTGYTDPPPDPELDADVAATYGHGEPAKC